MENKIQYRIRVVFIGKGIERSLPYEIHDEDAAGQVATMLNAILENNGYHHYVIPIETIDPSQAKRKPAHA